VPYARKLKIAHYRVRKILRMILILVLAWSKIMVSYHGEDLAGASDGLSLALAAWQKPRAVDLFVIKVEIVECATMNEEMA
jgi:hypothetical protein